MVIDVSRTSFLLGFLLVPRALFVETAPAAEPVSVLVEAEAFGDLGGWVVAPQFTDVMGYGTYPMPFWVPYRCLYSRNVANLFMAGRDISVTHEALGAVRVMRTGGCEGEVIGMAASLCIKHSASPRDIYQTHLADLQALMRKGVGKEPGVNKSYINQGEPAPKRAPASTDLESQGPSPIIDGRGR